MRVSLWKKCTSALAGITLEKRLSRGINLLINKGSHLDIGHIHYPGRNSSTADHHILSLGWPLCLQVKFVFYETLFTAEFGYGEFRGTLQMLQRSHDIWPLLAICTEALRIPHQLWNDSQDISSLPGGIYLSSHVFSGGRANICQKQEKRGRCQFRQRKIAFAKESQGTLETIEMKWDWLMVTFVLLLSCG